MSDLPAFQPATEFKYTTSPNPGWKYGQRVEETPPGKKWVEEGEKHGWTTLDMADLHPMVQYKLLTGSIAPRPVAFVSSVSKDGVYNLAPFSWFNQVASNPSTIMFSCTTAVAGRNNSIGMGFKDTPRNIQDTKGFTVNIISEVFVEQANSCNVNAPPNVSEWDFCGLTQEPSVHVKAPRVKESAFSMECEFLQAVEIMHPVTKQPVTTVILGTVLAIHIRKDIYDPVRNIIDPGKLQAVARMGGNLYGRINQGYYVERALWTDDEQQIKGLLESLENKL